MSGLEESTKYTVNDRAIFGISYPAAIVNVGSCLYTCGA